MFIEGDSSTFVKGDVKLLHEIFLSGRENLFQGFTNSRFCCHRRRKSGGTIDKYVHTCLLVYTYISYNLLVVRLLVLRFLRVFRHKFNKNINIRLKRHKMRV